MADKIIARWMHRPKAMTEAPRFWEKVEKSADPDGCWIYVAAVNSDGYGLFKSRKEGKWRSWLAHRWSYEELIGPIPGGLTLDHRECRTKRCVRPEHLVPCTHGENSLQPDGGGGVEAAKTACKNGHPFSAENTYVENGNGKRHCRICRAAAMTRYYEARAARRT